MLDFDVSSFCMTAAMPGEIALKTPLPSQWEMFSLERIVGRCRAKQLYGSDTESIHISLRLIYPPHLPAGTSILTAPTYNPASSKCRNADGTILATDCFSRKTRATAFHKHAVISLQLPRQALWGGGQRRRSDTPCSRWRRRR